MGGFGFVIFLISIGLSIIGLTETSQSTWWMVVGIGLMVADGVSFLPDKIEGQKNTTSKE